MKFASKLFELNKLELPEWENFSSPYFSSTGFLNCVKSDLLANDIIWAENFVKNYSSKLNEVVLENTVSIAHTEVEFAKQNYANALRNLSKLHNIEPESKAKVKVFI